MIRPASISDLVEIQNLVNQLGYFPTEEILEKALKIYIESENYGIFVEVIDNRIVGLIAYSKTKIFVSGKTRIHIEGLVVDKNHRRKGIARNLLLHLEKFVLGTEPVVVDLVSGVKRAPLGAHDFYKNMGYELEGDRRKIYFRKEL